ncbi:MAG: FAD:protein FMN transferase [Pseudomonadota bacterium]
MNRRPAAGPPRSIRQSLTVAVVAVVAAAAASLGGCGRNADSQIQLLTGSTMGTRYSVQLAGARADEALAADIQATLDRTESLMSTYRPDSAVSRFNAHPGTDWVAVAPALCEVIAIATETSELSAGAFDVTLGPLVDLWGFGPEGDVDTRPSQDSIDTLLGSTGYEKLETDCRRPAIRKTIGSLEVDLSGIAKGHGVDQVAGLLDARGYTDYLVEVGGEMRARGRKPDDEAWRIAIEAPLREQRDILETLELRDGAVATSGDYRNYFVAGGQHYSHLLDPRTGAPVRHATAAVTVIAADTTRADALATALLILGKADGYALAERENIAALFVERVVQRNGTDVVVLPTSRYRSLSGLGTAGVATP